MKTLEWQSFFAEQRERHGKVVFSVAELANAAQTTLHTVNTELGRLVNRGIIRRYAHGRYGPSQGVDPEDVVSGVDPSAYITGFYALFRHHLVTQVPTEVTCFTGCRHNRKSDRITPAGRLRFLCVPARIYARPPALAVAPPEQALCDFAWLSLREGIDPQSLVTFQNLGALSPRRLNTALRRYPGEVGSTVCRITGIATA
ncbi:MAG: hypothetical protein WCL11_16190 [Verrucomicrobiota bacterium]